MKKLTLSLIVATALSISVPTMAQDAPPPPDAHGSSGNRDPGAPIGGGLFILLGLGAAYGGKKIYDMRKEKLEE